MPVAKRDLIQYVVAELAAQPTVLQKHSDAHVVDVIMRLDRDTDGGRSVFSFQARLRSDLFELAHVRIVATCEKHGCPK